MFGSELFLLLAIFFLCVFLAYEDLRSALIFLLLVSLLLHKEVFSLVYWDVLPIRLTVLALLFTCFVKLFLSFRKNRDLAAAKKFLKDPVLALLLTLLVIRLISLINTKNIGASLLIFGFFSTMVFLYGLLSYLQSKFGQKFILSNIKFYAFVAFATSVIGLLQFILDRKYGIIFGALWRIPGKLSRVGSVFWDVNHYAGFISAIIPIFIALFLGAKSTLSKVLYGFITLFMTAILILTNSRSAWIGFAVSLGIIFLNLFIPKFKAKGLALVFLAMVLLSFGFLREYQDRESPIRERIKNYFHYRGDSFASHFLLLKGSFAIFTEHPIIGGGYGSFYEHFKDSYVAPAYYGRDPAALSVRVPAHSVWGEVISETGFLGIFTFSLLIFAILGSIFWASRITQERGDQLLLVSLFASAMSFLVSGVFYSYNAEFFYLIIFLSVVYAKAILGDRFTLDGIYSYLSKTPLFMPIVVTLAAIIIIFANLGSNHLIPWDEAIYAKVSKNMLTSGNYLMQVWDNNDGWFEKPPFYMWISSFMMSIFGFGSLGAKVPSAIFGVLTVILTYFAGKKLFNSYVGFLASFVLLTTTQFLRYSRVGMLDVTLTFFIFLSFYLYLVAREHRQKALLLLLSGASLGFAVMTKGVVGLLPIAILIASEVYHSLTKRGTLKLKDYVYYASAFLAIALPWHLYSYLTFGEDFYESYILYHVLKRATESVEGKGQPFFWYVVVLRTSMRIWFIPLALAVAAFVAASLIKPLRERLSDFSLKNHSLTLLFISSAIIYLFFSSSVSKLIWYIMPIYPFLALITSAFLMNLFELLINKMPKLNSSFVRFFVVFLVSGLGLLYLSYVRTLAYVTDDTGDVAELIISKDRVFGTDSTLYYDRIEKPLPLFYSDGEIVAVDYRPLINYIDDADFTEQVIFITKDSRYQKLVAMFPQILLTERRGDLVLAVAQSEAELMNERIAELQAEITWIKDGVLEGDPEAAQNQSRLPSLESQLSALNQEYSVGISAE